MPEPNPNLAPFLSNDEYNFFEKVELDEKEAILAGDLSHHTRKLIQNLISSFATSLLMVQTDLDAPLRSEIQRAYIKGMIDACKYLLDLKQTIEQENEQ